MKKILAILLTALLITAFIPAFAEEPSLPDKTEISFKVGDSTLLINGKELSVETPYVTGEGTTLVPLRVITEAFGAEVLWEGETKTITLNYTDVTIILQIDNKEAKVNDHTETLPVAPTLSASGVTMVPLRFISETFGAEVKYDNGLITVTKNTLQFGNTISSLTEKEKIGDSYHGWTMNAPKSLIISEKSIDGSEVSFSGENAGMYLEISDITEEYSLEVDYINTKSYISQNAALVRAELKKGENGIDYYVLQSKSDTLFMDVRSYVKENKNYALIFSVEGNDTATLDSMISIADSFRIESVTEDVYDISDVKDGMVLYKNETLKINFLRPIDFLIHEFAFNDILIYSNAKDDEPGSSINICVYSKTDNVDAKALAEKDRNSNSLYRNKEFSTFSEITEFTLNDIQFYKYTSEVKGTKKSNHSYVDVFFEKGNYIYNIYFYMDENASLEVDKILNSLEVSELDFKTIGNLVRDDNDPEIVLPVKTSNWSISIPSTWTSDPGSTASAAIFSHQNSNAKIYIECRDGYRQLSVAQLEATIKTEIRNSSKDKKHTSLKSLSSEKIDDVKYYSYSFKYTDEEETIYNTLYYALKDDVLLCLLFTVDDIYYTEQIQNEFDSIVKTLRLEYKKEN